MRSAINKVAIHFGHRNNLIVLTHPGFNKHLFAGKNHWYTNSNLKWILQYPNKYIPIILKISSFWISYLKIILVPTKFQNKSCWYCKGVKNGQNDIPCPQNLNPVHHIRRTAHLDHPRQHFPKSRFLNFWNVPSSLASRKKQTICVHIFAESSFLWPSLVVWNLSQATQIGLVWNQWSFHGPWHLYLRFRPHGHRGFLVGISFQHRLRDMEDNLQLAQRFGTM